MGVPKHSPTSRFKSPPQRKTLWQSRAQMAPNPVTFVRTYPSVSCFVAISPKPSSLSRRLSVNLVQISGFRVCSPCRFYSLSSNSSNATSFKDVGRSEMKVREIGNDYFRVSAVSDGGVGGTGSGFGDSGDGNSSGSGGGGGGGGGGDGDGAEGGGFNWSLLSWYLAVLEKHPVLTKAVTSALLNFIGDVTCQLAIDQVSTLDWKRTFLFTLLGFALVGPTLHLWYLYLSKLVTVPGASGAFLRLSLDQFLFSPIFLGVFLSTLVTLEGKPSQVVPKLQQEWFSAVVANWQLWIPFQFLNFRFVPQQFQVLAANVVALAWNVILSFKAHKQILPKLE